MRRSGAIGFAAALAGAAGAALGQLSATNAIKMNDSPFLMCEAHMGWASANGGNVNGDIFGIADMLVGAPTLFVERGAKSGEEGEVCPPPLGHASAWTGTGGTATRVWRQLGTFSPAGIPSGMGASLKGIGDVTGDGRADSVVSEWMYWINSNYNGRVTVRSGPSGGILASVTPPFSQEAPGTMLAAIGNVDGYPGSEFAALASAAPAQWPHGSGKVYLYSYRFGMIATLHTWTGSSHPYGDIAGPIGAVGDVNGDGYGDLAILFRDPFIPQNYLRVFSGVAPYAQIGPDITHFIAGGGWIDLAGEGIHGIANGEWIAPLTDLNGDGKAEFILGARGGASGRVVAVVVGVTPPNGTSNTPWQVNSIMEHPVGDTVFSGHRSVAAIPGPSNEVLVGIMGANTYGMGYAFKGLTGALVRYYTPEPPAPPLQDAYGFGSSVAGGDFNGDGKGDAVIGCHDKDLDPGVPTNHGQAYLFLGQ